MVVKTRSSSDAKTLVMLMVILVVTASLFVLSSGAIKSACALCGCGGILCPDDCTLAKCGGSRQLPCDCRSRCGLCMCPRSQFLCNRSFMSYAPCVYKVGGICIPVDKVGLLAPYIGLASTILVATVATAAYVKRARRREEKQ